MMNITKTPEGSTLKVALEGRLDTNTAKQLDSALADEYAAYEAIELDFAQLQYLSSAGLRVLLSAQKKMAGKQLTLINVNENIMEVFEITGFVDFLTIR